MDQAKKDQFLIHNKWIFLKFISKYYSLKNSYTLFFADKKIIFQTGSDFFNWKAQPFFIQQTLIKHLLCVYQYPLLKELKYNQNVILDYIDLPVSSKCGQG